jgi:hypothetical protein
MAKRKSVENLATDFADYTDYNEYEAEIIKSVGFKSPRSLPWVVHSGSQN